MRWFLIACIWVGLLFGLNQALGERPFILLNPYTRDKAPAGFLDEQIFKDWRVGVEHPIDDELIDLLFDIWDRVRDRAKGPMVIWSGYRTPSTNSMVGGADESYHMEGMAADISIPGIPTRELYELALELNRDGGVGYYPKEGFVHVDTGPKRRW